MTAPLSIVHSLGAPCLPQHGHWVLKMAQNPVPQSNGEVRPDGRSPALTAEMFGSTQEEAVCPPPVEDRSTEHRNQLTGNPRFHRGITASLALSRKLGTPIEWTLAGPIGSHGRVVESQVSLATLPMVSAAGYCIATASGSNPRLYWGLLIVG